MNNMKRWFKTSPDGTLSHSSSAGHSGNTSLDINGKHSILNNSQYFFRGDDLLDGYYNHAIQLRKEIEECKPQIKVLSDTVDVLSKHASLLSRTVDRACDTAQVWPAALRTYRTLHKHMYDTSQTTFNQTFVDDINDVYDQWLEECKQFLRELKRTNDNRSKRDESKHLVDSLFEEKVEGRKEWTEEQERTLQAAKAQLGKECTVYDGMVAGLKSHFEELCINRMRCMDVVFEHLLAQEFTLFRPLIKAMRSIDGNDVDISANSHSELQSPLSPNAHGHIRLRFNPMLQRNRFDKSVAPFESKHTLFGDLMKNANNLHIPQGSQGDVALMETVSLLQNEIVKREATEAEIQQLREQISALQSVETSVEQQEQLAELKRQLEHPDRQQHIRAQSIGDSNDISAPPSNDIVVGSAAPPPPGAESNNDMVVGSAAPPPPGMDAPPSAPGAPPPPGPPPPSFTFGTGGLNINKTALHHVKKLTPREQEIADAKKYNLPLFPPIEPRENVLLKKIHWQSIPAAEIKNTIWADVVMPKHDIEYNGLIPLLTDTSTDTDKTDDTQTEETKESTDIKPLSYNWELDTTQFESTFAQRAAVAMKKRAPRGKQYKIGERRSANKTDGDESKNVSGDSDDDNSSSENSALRLHESGDELDENGERIARIPKIIQKIELIDPKRSYNVSISLSRFKMSYEQLRDSVMNFDDSVLTLEMIDVLCEILPQPDEMSIVKAYTGSIDRLGDVEQFFLTMSVPGLAARLKSFVFLLSFSQLASAIQDAIDTVTNAYNTIHTSGEIRTLLGILLRFGNYLNAQNKLPQVYGFTLTSLSKIRGIKTLDNKSTLLHYVVNYINEHTPQTRAFVTQLEVCRPASRVESAYLIAEVKQLQQNLRILNTLINEDNTRKQAAANKGNVVEKYPYIPLSDRVYQFHKYATERINEIDNTLKQLVTDYQALAKRFLVSDMTWEQFFETWILFADEYTVCEQDIQIIIEIQQRKEKQLQAIELIKQRQANKSHDTTSNSSTPSDSPHVTPNYKIVKRQQNNESQRHRSEPHNNGLNGHQQLEHNSHSNLSSLTSSPSDSPQSQSQRSPNFNKPLPALPNNMPINSRRATINVLSPINTDKNT